MNLSREHERNLPLELDSKPKVLVTFFGYRHSPDNLQVIPRIADALRQHLLTAQGRTIVFLENSSGTLSQNERISKEANEAGRARRIADIILSNRLSRLPYRTEVHDYMNLIASKGLPEIISEKLIPEKQIQAYFLSQAFDQLREDFGFTYEYEHHPEKTNRENALLHKNASSFIGNASEYWDDGHFGEAIAAFRSGHQILTYYGKLRDRDNVEFLKRRASGFSQNPTGGSIFSLFGLQHHIQIEALFMKIAKKNLSVKIQSNRDEFLHSPAKSLSLRLGTKEAADIDYANGLLIGLINILMKDVCKEIRNVAWFMQNYESLENIFFDAVSEFSLDDLRRLCGKQKQGMVEIMDRVFSVGSQRLPMP